MNEPKYEFKGLLTSALEKAMNPQPEPKPESNVIYLADYKARK